ncbi:hypothetical protein F9K73_03605 [Brucella intermedia]|uniref:hypothetical protein n=1 Tax=Brucella intermedia TaxID=94625 RepID=UPI00124EEC02|nr:hypothetical protein [Brucella intermedia]KAB2723053.1 hypothetical protein F9K73_03605 [Brucella intermedia]
MNQSDEKQWRPKWIARKLEEGTTAMGRRAYEKLARICASLNTSEQELAHSLGISRVALKAIDRTDAPLYLRLALAALVSEMDPDEVLNPKRGNSEMERPLHLLSAG